MWVLTNFKADKDNATESSGSPDGIVGTSLLNAAFSLMVTGIKDNFTKVRHASIDNSSPTREASQLRETIDEKPN